MHNPMSIILLRMRHACHIWSYDANHSLNIILYCVPKIRLVTEESYH